MEIKKYAQSEGIKKGQENTVFASKFIPDGIVSPFYSSWGALGRDEVMEAHSHASVEIYVIIKGEGVMVVGEEHEEVASGDVIEIPSNVVHSIISHGNEPLMWAAVWWMGK